MSKSFTLDQLTEGIRQRHMGVANQRLVEKWSRTGLLRGMEGQSRENMSMLLENQAAQLLREQNSLGTGGAGGTSSGDVRGFTNIAFPIVRRVFGGLIANELVSIQPMSLPSGLLFYLDYTYGTDRGGDSTLAGAAGSYDAQVYSKGQSIYNSPTGKVNMTSLELATRLFTAHLTLLQLRLQELTDSSPQLASVHCMLPVLMLSFFSLTLRLHL